MAAARQLPVPIVIAIVSLGLSARLSGLAFITLAFALLVRLPADAGVASGLFNTTHRHHRAAVIRQASS